MTVAFLVARGGAADAAPPAPWPALEQIGVVPEAVVETDVKGRVR